MERDATKRFGSRVEHYVKHRPKYPESVLNFLQQKLKLTPTSIVADIGSGTGISSELFLSAGNTVFGVEPNSEMRLAAEKYLAAYPNFISVNGKAEATCLENHSVDFIVCGQAFHWFDRNSCKQEFQRILRPHGWIILLWNDRRQGSPFSDEYEKFLRTYAIDYNVVDHRLITREVLAEFFGNTDFGFEKFDNQQVFDLEGLQGRVFSCSYMPLPEHSSFNEMIAALTSLFEKFQQGGLITMPYDTLLYHGQITD